MKSLKAILAKSLIHDFWIVLTSDTETKRVAQSRHSDNFEKETMKAINLFNSRVALRI